MSTVTEKDAPMPPGVEAMTKQQLWNWFHRSTQAAAEQLRLREKFFTMTTGLHSSRSAMLGDPAAIVEAQRARIRGLETQMAQMQKGYDKKERKAVAKVNALGDKALGLLRRVRMSCLALDAGGEPTFDPAINRELYNEISRLLLDEKLEELRVARHNKTDSPANVEQEAQAAANQTEGKGPDHA